MWNELLRLLLLLGACVFSGAGYAQDSSTLQRIKERGSVVIGHRDIAIPFSFYNGAHQPVGYSIDICLRIVDAIKTELGLEKINVTYRELNASNRIPLVVNGTADMECGSTSNNVAREQQVAFSVTTFVASPRFITKKSSGLLALESLKGKKLAAVAGTATLRQFSEMNGKQHIGMIIMPAKDHASAFAMLANGEADAYGAIDTSGYSMVARSKAPENYFVSAPLAVDPFAVMFRKGDGLKKIADRTIVGLFQSGDIYQLYHKWFEAPLPSLGFNLNMPMSKALQKAIAQPTDSSNPNDYSG